MFKKSLSIALAIALGLSMSHVEVFADVEGVVPSVEQNEVVLPEEGSTVDQENINSNQNGGATTPTPEENVIVEENTENGKFSFNITTGEITKYEGTDTEITIPNEIKGVSVKLIGEKAFATNSKIESLILGDNVNEIKDFAFLKCTNLSNVQFNLNLNKIGNNAFNSTSLTNIIFEEGLTEIGKDAFANIQTLKSIKLPESLTKISDGAFKNKRSKKNNLLTSIYFGPNVRHVGHQIVKYCDAVKDYKIAQNGVKIELHDDIFVNIMSLDIPQEREIFLFARAFEGLKENPNDKNMKAVELNLGNIELDSFNEKEVERALNEKIKLTTGFAEVGEAVDGSQDIIVENDGIDWGNISNLGRNSETIQLVGKFKPIPKEKYYEVFGNNEYTEKKIEPIRQNIEKYNINVTLVKRENSWTSSDFTYGYCHYTMLPDGEYFGIKGLSDSGKEKLKTEKKLFIPKYIEVNENGVKKQKLVEGIASEAFRDLGIEKVIFPNNLNCKKDYVIDASAFLGNNISSLDIPNYVKYIDSSAFKGNNLTSLYIPSSVLKIGNNAFEGNNISNLEFSDDVEKIQIDNFSFANNQIKEVHLPYSIFKLLGEVFKGNPGQNKGKVYLYTRNPEHFSSKTYIKATSDYHQFILKGKDINREDLHKKINEANKLDLSDYTIESWNTFIGVLNDAKEVFKNEAATQEDIDKAYKSLNEAFVNLDSKGVNKKELRELLASVEDLRRDLYEAKSWTNLIKASEKAELVLNDSKVDQTKVNEAKKDLQDAISSLVVDEDMKYKVEDFTYDGTVVTGYSESGKKKFAANKDLVIPNINDKGEKITEIGKTAFETTEGVIMGTDTVKSPEGLTSAIIPSTVVKIGEGAFRNNSLEKIELPNKLEEIGMQAFNGNKLVSVSIPDSVKTMGAGAFSTNDKMKSIKLSKGMDVVPNGICARNISLEYIEIPTNVKVIEASAFIGAPLKKLTIPNSVVEIKDRAFSTNRLEVVRIPGNVKKIGRLAFENNKKFRTTKKVILEEGIEEIGSNAFKSCLIESAKLPNSLKKLDKSAFKDNLNENKEEIVTKLYTNNKEHLNFEDPKDTFEIIFKEAPVEPEKPIIPSEPSVPSIPSTPEKPQEEEKPEEKPEEGVKVEVVDKIAGENRYDTSVDISQKVYSSSQKVYLVSGEKFPDALSSAALAGKGDGPILLINDNNIDKILSEINRLGAKEIVFVGGNSISKANEDKIKKFAESKSSVVSAFAGENRYETAIKVAEETIAKRGNKGKVIIADGRNYPDAVSIASFSSKEGIPVILVNGNNVPKEVKAFLSKYKIKDAIVVGGTKAVGSDIEKLFAKVERVAGEDRYDTSKKIAERFFANSKTIFVASGESFADSLSVSYYAGKEHSPILLTKANSLDNDTREYLNANKDKNYIIIGGDKAVNPNLFN